MINYIRDLVKQLDSAEFVMTEEQIKQLATKINSPSKVHNVRSYFGDKQFAVQMRVAGVQHTLGITRKLYVAARYADMAHLYFVQIGARSFRKNDFNFDRATAEADLSNPVAGPLLGELTQHLFPNGVPAKPVKPKRKSLRLDLEALSVRVDELQRELTQVHGNLCSVQDKLSVL
jgi:hypothetical protein